jgi:hypothetical protein
MKPVKTYKCTLQVNMEWEGPSDLSPTTIKRHIIERVADLPGSWLIIPEYKSNPVVKVVEVKE